MSYSYFQGFVVIQCGGLQSPLSQSAIMRVMTYFGEPLRITPQIGPMQEVKNSKRSFKKIWGIASSKLKSSCSYSCKDTYWHKS